MTSTPQNQPHIPPLQIDLDGILATIALELAQVRICDQCQASVPSLIDDLAHLVTEITRLHSALVRERGAPPTFRIADPLGSSTGKDG
jgi:hypothetical protein